jgi:hypothetical protein
MWQGWGHTVLCSPHEKIAGGETWEVGKDVMKKIMMAISTMDVRKLHHRHHASWLQLS